MTEQVEYYIIPSSNKSYVEALRIIRHKVPFSLRKMMHFGADYVTRIPFVRTTEEGVLALRALVPEVSFADANDFLIC